MCVCEERCDDDGVKSRLLSAARRCVCVSVCVPWLVYETREIEHKLSDKQMYEAALVVAHVCPLTAIIAFLPLKTKNKKNKRRSCACVQINQTVVASQL